MWKDYSKSYIRYNRASGLQICAAALTASFFLTLFAFVSYNLWVYEMETRLLEGSAMQTGKEADSIALLPILFAGIMLLTAISLILIIRGSFEVSMQARIHQLGILISIGATPAQIRVCLLQEAAVLSLLPMFVGGVSGTLADMGLISLTNVMMADVSARRTAVFRFSPAVFAAAFLTSALTVLISAWMPARKISRMTPLQAIRNADMLQIKRRKHSRLLSMLFGVEGEVAGNAWRARKKAMRISNASLLLSFLSFSLMLGFTTLSQISTRFTYFERYQDVWDIMVTVKHTDIEELAADSHNGFGSRRGTGQLGDEMAYNVALYQKAESLIHIPSDRFSDELTALGGLSALTGNPTDGGKAQVDAPLVILDDDSFLEYCGQTGISPRLDGAIVINQIWDSINSNFRYKKYVPFVEEEERSVTLYSAVSEGNTAEIPVLDYTYKEPVLREEYDDYALVHVIPMSLWKRISPRLGGEEEDSYIRILAEDRAEGRFAVEDSEIEETLDAMENAAVRMLEVNYEVESENRIRKKRDNDRMIMGLMVFFGSFCVLLGVIGIANVFSSTLGFLNQRKKEFAQYMSVGMTPAQMKKLFFIEASVMAGRPLALTIPLTAIMMQLMTKASFLEPKIFWREAPVMPICLFAAAIVLFVALAYYLGARRILRCDLNAALRDDLFWL